MFLYKKGDVEKRGAVLDAAAMRLKRADRLCQCCCGGGKKEISSGICAGAVLLVIRTAQAQDAAAPGVWNDRILKVITKSQGT